MTFESETKRMNCSKMTIQILPVTKIGQNILDLIGLGCVRIG
jgi:hypothetical protein